MPVLVPWVDSEWSDHQTSGRIVSILWKSRKSLVVGVGRMKIRSAIPGVMPPQLAEVPVRECRPTVMEGYPGLARLGQKLMQTLIFAPLAWLLLAPLFVRKFLPVVSRRYTLTNQAIKIQAGLVPRPIQTIRLEQIDDVRLDLASYNPFYRSGNLEILTGDQVSLLLKGVPNPQSFRRAILNATIAWVPGKSKQLIPWSPAS